MKASVYCANGAAIADIAKPTPKGTQVLVRVHACGLNRADLGMTKGHVHGSAGGVGTVLGMEWAGEEAATLPVALTTMHNAVVTNGALQAGQSVLIQGASSGVGLMAMQIAKLKGAKLVIGSSTDATRRSRLKEFGADLAIDSSDPGWVDQGLNATNGEGVDLIVDQV